MMLKTEREKPFFQELHGFEELEDILELERFSPTPSVYDLKVNTSMSVHITEDSSPCDSEVEEKTYVEKDVVLIEKFYRSRESSPTQGIMRSDSYSGGSKTAISPNGSVKDDSDCTPERLIETKRMATEKFFLKREFFLLKVEDYLRKLDAQKSTRGKTTTKVTRTEKIDILTNTKTTTTVTERTVSEPILIPSCVTVPGYAESSHLDFSNFPATKDWSAAMLFATLSSEVLLKTLHLLLTEKSLIIYGADMGYVTATALAIKELLKPLTWEGIFVPMLSTSAKELFEAPVPFILGTTFMPNFDFLSPSAAVLHIQAPEESGPRSGTGPKSPDTWNPNTSEKSDSFDTWKDCESNPKKSKKSMKSEKSQKTEKTEKTETFSSVQSFEDDERGTPRAWFLRLPDMEERMPSLPSLGAWIDRTRRFLSNSVVHAEMKRRRLRFKEREEKERIAQQDKESSRRRFDDGSIRVDLEKIKVAEAALQHCEDEGRKVGEGTVRGQREVQGSRDRCFSIGADRGRSSLTVPILDLSMRSPCSTAAAYGGSDPAAMSTAEYSDGEYEESPPPHKESESRKYEIHSELLLKLERARNSALRCTESRTELLSDLLAENVTDLESESGAQSPKRHSMDENMAIKRRTVSFSLESFSLDSSEIMRYSTNVQPVHSLHPEIPTSSPTASSPTNHSLFKSHANSPTSRITNIGAPLGDTASYTPSRHQPSRSSSFAGPNNILTPDTSTLNLVSISPSPLPTSYTHDIFPPTGKSPSTSEKSSDKVLTDMGDYSKRTEAILSMQAVEVASNYSPQRAQGHGKTWLEQIIKATDKPLRQTNTKRPVRSRRNQKGTSEGASSPGLGTESLSPTTHRTTSSVKSELSCYSFRAPALSPTPRIIPVKYPPCPPLLPFINGMTPMELRTTQKLVSEIRRYIGTFLGRASEPNAWKDFVKYNRATNDDEFFPDVSSSRVNLLYFLFFLMFISLSLSLILPFFKGLYCLFSSSTLFVVATIHSLFSHSSLPYLSPALLATATRSPRLSRVLSKDAAVRSAHG
jgi:DENN (AEX-3) domain